MANHGLDHGPWVNHDFQKRVDLLSNYLSSCSLSPNTKLLPGQSLYATGRVYASAPPAQRSVLIFLFIPGHVPPSFCLSPFPSTSHLPGPQTADRQTTKRQLIRGRVLSNRYLPFLTLPLSIPSHYVSLSSSGSISLLSQLSSTSAMAKRGSHHCCYSFPPVALGRSHGCFPSRSIHLHNISLGDKDSIHRGALWALESKPSPEIERRISELCTDARFPLFCIHSSFM